MILPFLENNAVVVFHDTALHTQVFLCPAARYHSQAEILCTNNLLMSAIAGKKILQGAFAPLGNAPFPNIAGIRVTENTKAMVFELFNLLMLKWHYIPTEKHEQELISWFEKYYNEYYIDYLKKVFSYQRRIYANKKLMPAVIPQPRGRWKKALYYFIFDQALFKRKVKERFLRYFKART